MGLWICNHRLPLDGRVSQGYPCNVVVDLPVKARNYSSNPESLFTRHGMVSEVL